MAAFETRPVLPPGLLNGLVFFGVVVFGAGYIIFSKLNDFGAFAVTSVPVLIMIGYAVLLGARLFRLRDDQSGDNLYYMGFLFTLTSLAVSLYQFSAAGSAEQIVQNFGIAIASTIAGITLRILFNQMRRDPVEVEATARMELAEASRRVKRELESAILEFGYFRRMTQQSVTDALDEARESIGQSHREFSGELKKLASATNSPFEEASKRSEQTLDGLNGRTLQVLDVSRQLVREGEQLAKSTAKIVGAIDQSFRQARLAPDARADHPERAGAADSKPDGGAEFAALERRDAGQEHRGQSRARPKRRGGRQPAAAGNPFPGSPCHRGAAFAGPPAAESRDR